MRGCARSFTGLRPLKSAVPTVPTLLIPKSRACTVPRNHPSSSASMSKKFYITTAIDYANGSPHLGHAYEKVLTDIVARFRRMMGDEVK
ncbi:MAG TPA: class I tRNA ligase family protein, partial [Opitutales bacterium]|nr:class I tRNA ligase family protein [Opitutales bacterium]